MPRFVLGDRLQNFAGFGVNVGQRHVRVVAALGALLDHHRQRKQVDQCLGYTRTKSETTLIAIVDRYRRSAEFRDSLGPQPRMASFVGQVSGHLELRLATLHVSEKIKQQTRASKFGIAIEAEDKNLLFSGS